MHSTVLCKAFIMMCLILVLRRFNFDVPKPIAQGAKGFFCFEASSLTAYKDFKTN